MFNIGHYLSRWQQGKAARQADYYQHKRTPWPMCLGWICMRKVSRSGLAKVLANCFKICAAAARCHADHGKLGLYTVR
jgi:hypothetical protein